jgi:hypothetical protein
VLFTHSAETFSRPSDIALAARALFNHLPLFAYRLARRIPNNAMKRLVYYQWVARRIAQRLVAREQDAIHEGKPVANDMMSLLGTTSFTLCTAMLICSQ